jgi:hypothetical protein
MKSALAEIINNVNTFQMEGAEFIENMITKTIRLKPGRINKLNPQL